MVTKMNKVTVVGIIFALFTIGWILGTGQWAYGNVVGPLFNNSKLPKLNITYIQAYNTPKGVKLVLNITDIDGPDAYPASGSTNGNIQLHLAYVVKFLTNIQ